MKTDEMKTLAANYMEIWRAGNDALLDKFASEHLTVDYTHFPRPCVGIADYKAMLKGTYEYFPDLVINLKNIIPDQAGNSVTIFWEYVGTHKNGNLFGVESSNRKVRVNGITLLEIGNGLVVAEKGIVDNLSLIMQLGVLEQSK